MKPLALRWRLSLLGAAALVVIITAICAVAYHELEESLQRHADRALQAMANAILGELREELAESRSAEHLAADIRVILAAASHQDPTYCRVWLEGQAADLVASPPPAGENAQWLRALPAGERPKPDAARHFNLGRRKRYRAIWLRGSTPRGNANILVAESTDHARHEMGEFLRMLLVLGGSMAVGSVVVGAAVVLWALRPIGRTAAHLRQVTERNLGGGHLADLQVPRELETFRNAVTELLARLDGAVRQLKQFTADASHELRTPLAVAKSTLQVARTKDRDVGEYKRAIDETLDDLARMERLIQQLLILARVDADEPAGQAADLRLDELLATLARTVGAPASGAGGKVVCEDLPPVRIRGDQELLAHLFGNLLDNAIKHGPAAGTVRVTLAEGPETDCTVCIHDEGGTIPAEALGHVFDRFFRVDPSRDRTTGGAGLGLAIARQIARQHGGDIAIDSHPSCGTRVSVRLPRR